MSKIARIIAGVDPRGTSLAAVEIGATLARQFGASLELFSPVYNAYVTMAHFETRDAMTQARERLVRRYQEWLEQSTSERVAGLAVECLASWDHPLEEALIRRVMDRTADLLVVALPAGESRRPLSSAQWQLVRHCPAPVLLTRGRAWARHPVVAAAIDPTGRQGQRDELDLRILAMGDALAEAGGGTLHAVHAWERGLRAYIGELEHPLGSQLPELELERRQRELVYGALAAAKVAPARVALVEGRPEAALPSYCLEEGADVVVMGAVARNPFGRIFIGSTAERVLDELPCDLLVVKPEGFRTPVPHERWPREAGAGPVPGVPGI